MNKSINIYNPLLQPHLDQTRQFLNEWCHMPWDNELGKFAWVVALAGTNEGIGVVLAELEDKHAVQIHFGIGHDFARQGLITEAGREVVPWLMAIFKFTRTRC